MKEEERQEGRSRDRASGFLQACIYLFPWKELYASYVPGLILPSADRQLAIASSFPPQIKDQSLNMLFSFSIRLWLNLPPASRH